jgi:hypothetical protein
MIFANVNHVNYIIVNSTKNNKVNTNKIPIYHYKCHALSFNEIKSASKIILLSNYHIEHPKLTKSEIGNYIEWEFYSYSNIINIQNLWKNIGLNLDLMINTLCLYND